MKRKTLLLLLLLAAISPSSFAQFQCGFDIVHKRQLKMDPSYRKRVAENEKFIQAYINKNKKRLSARVMGTDAALYTIPVVVHVIHTGGAVGSIYSPSDAKIQAAINYLNQVYNGTLTGTQGVGDVQIQFELAKRDPNCNPTNGINRVNGSGLVNYAANCVDADGANSASEASELNLKNLVRWNPFDYYNIWIVNKIDGSDGTSGTFTAGYAYYPGAHPTLDGTIMLATQMDANRKTLPHEIGHAFGLAHPFEGSSGATCPSNTNCATDGDMVCDTDPITQPAAFTRRTGTNTCTGTSYNDYTECNYMNYTNCYTLFTPGRKSRMLAAAASVYRSSLATSSALTTTNILYPYATPITPSCTPATGAYGLSGDYIGTMNIRVDNRDFGSAGAGSDGGYVDGTTCIKLVQLNKDGTYNFSATVLDENETQLAAWLDYNNNGIFENATERIHVNPSFGSIEGYTTTGTFTIPQTAVTNQVLRMRVISEASIVYDFPPISSACDNSVYGQGEDYPVYLTMPTVLPVHSIDFAGRMVNNKITSNWKTLTEQNVQNFDIEKSTDGVTFNLIGRIRAKGDASNTTSYSFDDVQVDEVNYYRLRINDADGKNSMSDIILIKPEESAQQPRVINNPFHQYIDVRFAKKAKQAKFQLINTNGSIVAEHGFVQPSGQVRWHLGTGLSNGIYILRAVVDGEAFSFKVIKE